MKEWKKPTLEKLEVGSTMAGPGMTIPDGHQPDPDEMVHFES
ncbi:paeninodin family lasso peptide [Jeotgalibacillus sp. S-D1]|nr:paeninodin family lasso peptide [Jeotgalibacillus sp. S-D1]TDL31809.1 paeninodin family lasso peptide [Jeotgalibacillus sp. S-D1]